MLAVLLHRAAKKEGRKWDAVVIRRPILTVVETVAAPVGVDHDSFSDLLPIVRKLAKLLADDHFVQLTQRIEEIFNQLSGMNGRQILKALAVEKPSAGLADERATLESRKR